MSFDFAGFKHAFMQQDVAAWSKYFAVDARWLEYKHGHPPRGSSAITRQVDVEAWD